MNDDPTLSAILADLWKIRRWCGKHPSKKPPPSAVAYIAANKDALLFFIQQLDSTSRADRSSHHSQHRELDEAVTYSDCSVARSAVGKAVMIETGNRLTELTDDDVNMIIRPIEYVKYLNCDYCPDALDQSPIQLPN